MLIKYKVIGCNIMFFDISNFFNNGFEVKIVENVWKLID